MTSKDSGTSWLIAIATLELDYVAGARMTGAGFGGCTVNLVEEGHLEEFSEHVTTKYLRSTAKRAQIYLA